MNCCFCGISLLTNTTSTPFLCIRCSSLNKKLSDTIKTHETLTHCRGCDRYLCPPKKWIELEWLSIDMMQMLLKRKNDIKKYKINESIFLKSEKTSRRFILKLNISYNPDEVHNDNISTTLYDTVLIQYRLTNKQCSDCEKREAKQYWNYIVQVRQKTLAKYNIYQLEHKIIGSHNDILHATSNIKSRKDGIDFYYLNKIEAKKMIKYLENIIIPTNIVNSHKLISEDRNNNTAKNKYTTSIEIIPLNKYDLIYIDNSYAKKRNIHQIAVVISISTYIKIVDVIDNKIICISKMEYMANKDNIKVLLSAKYLSKYIITEIEEDRYGYQNKKDNDKTNVSVKNIYLTKDYDKTYHSKTYLPFIYESDEILCYDLENYKVPELEEYKENDNKDIYDVIPVRRVLRDMEHIKHLKKIYNKKKITDIEHKYFIEDIYIEEQLENGINLYDKDTEVLNNMVDLQL